MRELAHLVNSLELGGQGTTVSLGLTIPPAVIDMLGALRCAAASAAARDPGRHGARAGRCRRHYKQTL